jgi:hypothetical protein
VVVPFDAKKSRLLALVRHQEEPHMPSNAPKLSEETVEHRAAWIDSAPLRQAAGREGYNQRQEADGRHGRGSPLLVVPAARAPNRRR